MSSKDEYQALMSLIKWTDEHLHEKELPGDQRSRMICGCYDVALEHQAAIALLYSRDLYGSMYALLRVLQEATVRGLWIQYSATDEQIEKFKNGRLKMHYKDFLEAVEVGVGFPDSPLSVLKANTYTIMNGFTHTGFEQIVRRNSESITGPNYSDDDTSLVLRLAGMLGQFAACGLAIMAGQDDLVHAVIERMAEYTGEPVPNRELSEPARK